MEITDITFTVRWSDEDNWWVATCDLFPSLRFLSEQADGAFNQILSLVEEEIRLTNLEGE